MRPLRRLVVIVVATLVVASLLNSALLTTVAQACPNCKEALAAGDPSHNGIVKGYFYSILLMMGTPFTVLGLFSAMMYREVLKARAAQSTAKKSAPGVTANVDGAEPTDSPDSAANQQS